MKTFRGALVVSALGLLAANAQAEAYLSLGYGHHEQNDRFFGDDRFETGEAIAKMGGRVTDWFTVELRAGTTVNSNEDDLRNFPGVEGEYRVDYFYGAYTKFGLPNKSVFTPYAVVGYTEGKESMDVENFGSESQRFYDTSYGGGVDVALGERLGLNVEYMLYYDKDNVTFKGPSASAVWKF